MYGFCAVYVVGYAACVDSYYSAKLQTSQSALWHIEYFSKGKYFV